MRAKQLFNDLQGATKIKVLSANITEHFNYLSKDEVPWNSGTTYDVSIFFQHPNGNVDNFSFQFLNKKDTWSKALKQCKAYLELIEQNNLIS